MSRLDPILAATAAVLLIAAALASPAGAAGIDAVDPSNGTSEEATHVTLSGEGIEPAARVSLVDGGPYEIARVPVPHFAYGVYKTGDRAYVAFTKLPKTGGVQVFDVGDPARPVPLCTFQQENGDQGNGVTFAGGYAYVSIFNIYTRDGGVHIVSLHDETSPSLESTFWIDGVDAQNNPRKAVVSGELIYVADTFRGLAIGNVADPVAPYLVGSYDTPGLPWDLDVAGRLAYVADGPSGLAIVDATDPSEPRLAGGYAPAGASPSDLGTLGVAVDGTTAYLAESRASFSGLLILDVSNPAAPVVLSRHGTASGATGVDLVGNLAYVTDGIGGLQVVDVGDARRPVFVGGTMPLQFTGNFFDVDVSDGIAYVADVSSGLRVLDVTDPASPALAAALATAGPARALAVSGTLAHVAEGDAGIEVLDVSDPASPRTLGGLSTPGSAEAIAVSNGVAFVAAGSAGLSIAGVSNPSAPEMLANVFTGGSARGVAVDGDHAYVAASGNLKIFDVTNPSGPEAAGSFRTRDARGVAVADGFAYVADRSLGLTIVDVSDPASPIRAGGIRPPGLPTHVALGGSTAYVSVGSLGVQLVDVSNPASPTLMAKIGTAGRAGALALRGKRLAVAQGLHGVEVWDVSDPWRPVLVAKHDTPGEVSGAAFAGDHLVLSDLHLGLQVARLNPDVEDVSSPSDDRLEFTVPTGYTPGPYDVRLANPSGSGATLANGFRVCAAGDLASRLEPAVVPAGRRPVVGGAVPWRLALEGDGTFFDPVPRHESWLALPELPSELRVEFRQAMKKKRRRAAGTGDLVIELAVVPGEDAGFVRLTGDDEAGARAMWDGIVEAGGIALPRIDARTYGDFLLSVRSGGAAPVARSPVPGGAASGDGAVVAGGLRRVTGPVHAVSYRYELLAGGLRSATASGAGSDLVFRTVATDGGGCETRAEASYRTSVSEACEELAREHPELAILCP